MFGPAVPAVVPALLSGDIWQELLPNQSHSEVPRRPLIVPRKVFGRGHSLQQPLPTKRPHQLTELSGNFMRLLEYSKSLRGARTSPISFLCDFPLTSLPFRRLYCTFMALHLQLHVLFIHSFTMSERPSCSVSPRLQKVHRAQQCHHKQANSD